MVTRPGIAAWRFVITSARAETHVDVHARHARESRAGRAGKISRARMRRW